MKTLVIAFASAFVGAIVAVGLLHGIGEAGAQRAGSKMKVSPAGSVPTELGELVHAGGDIQQKVLFFVDTDRNITIVRVTNKVSTTAHRITRTAPEVDEESGDGRGSESPKVGSKQKIGDMTVVHAGEIPSEWGEFVSSSSVRNDSVLVFRDDSSTIRLAEFRGTTLTPRRSEITREY